MRTLNFKVKFLINLVLLIVLIIWNVIQHNPLYFQYGICLFVTIITQLGLHGISLKITDDESLLAAFIFYTETSVMAIVMYNANTGLMWIILPFLYICETIIRNDNVSITTGQKIILSISAFVTYILRIVAVKLLPYHYDSLAEICMFIGSVTVIIIVLQNVAKGKEFLDYTMNKTQDSSIRDGLTQLYNRAALNQKIKNSLKNIGGVSVIMMDIDNFKKVNDTYGHIFGDTVLKNLAKILLSIENSKTTPYRYGGEEFTIVCTSMREEEVFAVAEKVRTEFNSITYCLNDEEKRFSLSLGMVCACYKEYTSAEKLIKDSDEALYEAKHTGKNKVIIFKKGEDEKS